MFKSRISVASASKALLSSAAICASLALSADTEPGEITVRPVILSSGTHTEIDKVARPHYPRVAAQASIENWVKLRFDVDERGRPFNIEVLESGGATKNHQTFEKNAKRALRDWRFKPATLDGKPVVRQNLTQFITFQISGNSGAMTEPFQNRFFAVSTALDEQDLDRARHIVQSFDEIDLKFLSEHAYLAMIKAMVWQAVGDNGQALEQAERALNLFTEASIPQAHQQVLRSAVYLNAEAKNFHTALERYETFVENADSLAEDDPIHEVAQGVRDALNSDKAIIREGIVEPCARCTDETGVFTGSLNRSRFVVAVNSGRVKSVRINCYPAHTTVAWEPEVAWSINKDAKDCSIELNGDKGSKIRLIEIPASLDSAAQGAR